MPVPSLPVDSATSCSIQSGRPMMCVPSVTRPSLSRRGVVRRRSRRPSTSAGFSGLSIGDLEQRGLGLVEQLGDVDAGEAGRHEAERGERGVAAADGRVGVEDAVAVCAGGRIERRAGVGHDDDALEPGRCRGRGTPPRRRAWRSRSRRWSRTSTRRPARSARARRLGVAVERGEHLAGRGRVEDRRAARPTVCAMTSGASDEPPMPASTTRVTPLATQLGAQRLDLGDERPRDRDGLHPAETLRMPRPRPSAPHSDGVARGDAARRPGRRSGRAASRGRPP